MPVLILDFPSQPVSHKLGQNTMNAQQLNQFLTDHFPQVADEFVVKVSATGELTVEMPISDKNS